MKKSKKILLRVFFAFLILACIVTFTITPYEGAEGKDVILYRIAGIILLLALLCGVIIELGLFGLQEKIKLSRGKRWGILVAVGIIGFAIPYSMISTDGKEQMASNTAIEETKKHSETVKEEAIKAEEAIETEKATTSKKTTDEPIIIEESYAQTDENPYEIENEDFAFDDAVYTINGVEITFSNVNLKWEVSSPTGYSITFDYVVKNNNSGDACVKFTTIGHSEFRYNDVIVRCVPSANNGMLKGTEESLVLNSGESQSKKVIYNAFSQAEDKRINGVDFPAVDVEKLMSNQKIEIDIEVNVFVDDKKESSILTFTLNE